MPDDLLTYAEEQRLAELQHRYLYAPKGLKEKRWEELHAAVTEQLRREQAA